MGVDESIVIRASDLRDSPQQLLDQVVLEFGAVVEPGADYYLDVDRGFVLDMTAEPAEGALTSQFRHDVGFIYQLLDLPGSDRPAATCPTWRDTDSRVLRQLAPPDVDRRCMRMCSRRGRAIRRPSEY